MGIEKIDKNIRLFTLVFFFFFIKLFKVLLILAKPTTHKLTKLREKIIIFILKIIKCLQSSAIGIFIIQRVGFCFQLTKFQWTIIIAAMAPHK